MIYAARYETMNALIDYLTKNCCCGVPLKPRGPATASKGAPAKRGTVPA
jgi:hypothetical protein